jgi:hypothetical protein
MDMMSLRPGEGAGSAPIIRHIKTGRYGEKRTKSGMRLPEQLDRFLVTHTYEDPADPDARSDDKRRNLKVDDEAMSALLRRQAEIDPTLPSDKLMVIEVRLPHMTTVADCFDGEFHCSKSDGSEVICKGRVGRGAVWDTRVAPPNLDPTSLFPPSHIMAKPGKQGFLYHIQCDGLSCVLAKENRVPRNSQYPEFPFCQLQWNLFVHLEHLRSTFGMVRFRSTSENGYRFTASTIQKLITLMGGEELPHGASLLLRMTRKRNKHGGMSTLVYLDANAGAYALLRGMAEERRALVDARIGAKMLSDGVVVSQLDDADFDVVESEIVAEVEEEREEAPPAKASVPPAAADSVKSYDELKQFVMELVAGDEDGGKSLLKAAWAQCVSSAEEFPRVGDVDGLNEDFLGYLQATVESLYEGQE